MPYATSQNITDRYGADLLSIIADRDGDDSVDEDAVNAAITDADDLINSYVAGQYDLPLADPAPSILTRFSVDIAVYLLGSDTIGAVEERRKRYDDAIAHLRRIGKGEAKLGITAEEDAAPAGGELEISSDERLFSRTTLSEF